MNTFLECLPCLVRQTYEAVSFATADETLRERLLREALKDLSEIRIDQSPPHMATLIHRMIREKTGCADPYRAVKHESNRAASALYWQMKGMVQSSGNPFATALRLSIAGNVIDFGAPGRPDNDDLPEVIADAMSCRLFGVSPELLQERAKSARNVLILGDNAGEIAFDRLLVEELSPWRCTYVVKGSPVINDATIDDAAESGMLKLTRVINNGSDAPGTILEWCSPEFQEIFMAADVVIAKGQGNFETLSGNKRPDLFFLLKAKCPVIARHIGCEHGDFVLTSTNGDKRA